MVNIIRNKAPHQPVALVTGGSSGIGREVAVALQRSGYRVYTGGRGAAPDSFAALGIHYRALDLTDAQSVRSAVGAVLAAEGRVDVLVNSAGYGAFGSVEDVDLADARTQFEVNLFGLVLITQLCLPVMREQQGGRIINVSSLAGFFSAPMGGWYSASKFALEGLSDSLRLEVRQFGIDVVLVEPGPVRTGWHAHANAELVRASNQGAYADMARGVSSVLTGFDADRITSDPDAVAEVICAAALARRPKARYLVGSGAHLAIALRRVLPTRMWDSAVIKRHTLSPNG
jgi:NAD(P)-dependent dehydrogenase (short-subunit alcohol dehydrogenase family)